MIKPRYLGDLVRVEPLHNFIIEKFNESHRMFKNHMNNDDMSSAARELGKQEAYKNMLEFLNRMEWY